MSVDLLCVGHSAYDINLYLPEFPRENSKAEVQDLVESGGGPAANAAYLASLWGLRSAFAGLVADDAYGRAIKAEFETVGTDVSLLELRPDHLTPLSVILVNAQTGSRTIVNRKAPHAVFQLPASFQSLKPRCLLFDGHELEASLQSLEAFPGAVSVLDAGSVRPGTMELARRVDYLIASERYALQVTGQKCLETLSAQTMALAALKSGAATQTVITLGERGLISDDQGEVRHLPAFPVKAIDTTGAGDVFHGAFAHGLVGGLSFTANLRRSSMAAALSVQVRGGRKSIPSLEQVEEALAHAD